MEALERAHKGEEPGLLYLEYWSQSEFGSPDEEDE